MKKIIISMIGLSLMVGMYSCKKDQAKPDGLINNESEMMKRSRKVVTLIKEFKEEMNSDLKSGGSISLDSAVWNMEATLNYDYADPDSASALFITRKSVYTLDIDANEFSSLIDIETVYDLMEDTLEMQFLDLINTVKIIVMCDVSIDSTDATKAYLTLTNGFGLDLATQYDPIDDDWIWGTMNENDGFPSEGKCDTTEYVASDGSNELKKRLNNPTLVSGEEIFFTNIETFEVSYVNCYYNEPPGLPRVFSVLTGPNDPYCMDVEELTFFLEAADWIIYDYNDVSNDYSSGIVLVDGEGARPDGKDFISIEIIDDLHYLDTKFYHNYFISYGFATTVPPSN